jgi:hypothetical protein
MSELWQDESNAFLKGRTMPRASTLIFILAALALYVIGLETPAQFALFLAMGFELVVWKRAADKLQAARIARTVRPRIRR